MLKAAHLIGNSKIPITGINTGRLGFLSNISKNHIKELILSIRNKKYTISQRSVIKIFTKPSLKNNIFITFKNKFTV